MEEKTIEVLLEGMSVDEVRENGYVAVFFPGGMSIKKASCP